MASLPALLNPQTPNLFSPPFHPSLKLSSLQSLKFSTASYSFSPSFHSSFPVPNPDAEDHTVGDCLVFEEGVFEDPILENEFVAGDDSSSGASFRRKLKLNKEFATDGDAENLVPDEWREVQAEINITKKEKRKIALELQFNSRVERKRKGLAPVRSLNLEEFQTYREAKLNQLKPLVLDNPRNFPEKEDDEVEFDGNVSERVAPKNPRWAVYGRGFDDVNEFFNSGNYVPGQKDSQGRRKLFTKEEKVLLNKRIPDLAIATSMKWLPLHTLAASGDFYLMNTLLKHNVDINAVDADDLTALHKAIISKKQAITSYLLRESANPFVRDSDGATLMHYAVQTVSTQAIKLLLLYNVDINLQDNDGWTPLHVATQARRTDIVKLLLIKGADKTIRNKDGLTALDLCLYCGRDTRTYELIKLLKQFSKKSTTPTELPPPNI